jgi:hypothetical protein
VVAEGDVSGPAETCVCGHDLDDHVVLTRRCGFNTTGSNHCRCLGYQRAASAAAVHTAPPRQTHPTK